MHLSLGKILFTLFCFSDDLRGKEREKSEKGTKKFLYHDKYLRTNFSTHIWKLDNQSNLIIRSLRKVCWYVCGIWSRLLTLISLINDYKQVGWRKSFALLITWETACRLHFFYHISLRGWEVHIHNQ